MADENLDLDNLIYDTSKLSEEIVNYIINYEENEIKFLKDIIDIDKRDKLKHLIANIINKLRPLNWYQEEFLNDLMFEGSGPIYSTHGFFNEIKKIIDYQFNRTAGDRTAGDSKSFKELLENEKDVKDFFKNMNNEELINHKFRNTIAGLYVDKKIENLLINDNRGLLRIQYTFIKRMNVS